jgi:hypothetical protein
MTFLWPRGFIGFANKPVVNQRKGTPVGKRFTERGIFSKGMGWDNSHDGVRGSIVYS